MRNAIWNAWSRQNELTSCDLLVNSEWSEGEIFLTLLRGQALDLFSTIYKINTE